MRAPREACGILFSGIVVELPNYAETDGEYTIKGLDVVVAVKDICEGSREEVNPSEILIWHTHPSGLVGPSEGDLSSRLEMFRYAVVSLPNGEVVEF